MMKILLTFNEGYAPHAAVVMESAIRNSKDKLSFIILYFEDELSFQTIDVLKKHFAGRLKSLDFHVVENHFKCFFEEIQYTRYLSINTFLRLLAPVILENEKMVLYLDCDLLILGDISELILSVNEDYAVNAVAEHYPPKLDYAKKNRKFSSYDLQQYEKKKLLNMKPDSPYFNAGVLIMNLDIWRSDKMFDKICQFINNHPVLPCADQDALNGVLDGNFGILPPRWNVFYHTQILKNSLCLYTETELKDVYESPQILHFASSCKVWNYHYPEGLEKETYWKYRYYTPWSDRIEEGKNLSGMIKRKILRPLKKRIKQLVGLKNIERFRKIIK